MKPSEALYSYREQIRLIVEQNHACNVRVFGSASRGHDTGASDLDLLVDPLPGATLFDLGAIQVELEDMLGIPVDVLTPDLPAQYRAQVLQEAVPV